MERPCKISNFVAAIVRWRIARGIPIRRLTSAATTGVAGLSFLVSALSFELSAFAQVPFAYWAPSSGPANTPASGYYAWWNPNANLSTTGGIVTRWTDQSANAIALTPEATGPTTTTRNGNTYLVFNGPVGNTISNSTVSLSSSWELVAVVYVTANDLDGEAHAIALDNTTARGALLSESQWEIGWFGISLAERRWQEPGMSWMSCLAPRARAPSGLTGSPRSLNRARS